MIYVHTPFCASKCIYCDFNTYVGREEMIDDYTAALVKEIRARSDSRLKISTIYFGGGNPLKLGVVNLSRIMRTVRKYYSVDKNVEISLEANPEDVNTSLLTECSDLGFNRLSLGIQSFDDKKLIFLRRRHTAKEAVSAYNVALEAGFDNVNIDLIFGLPGQSVEEWRRELKQVVALEPSHVSAYGLSVEPGTPLYAAIKKGNISIPDEENQARMMEITHNYLSGVYHHYEISNFARCGFECRHNLNYWLGRDYLGFGAGAYSCLNNRRFCNIFKPESYIRAIFNGGDAIAATETLTKEIRLAESIFLGLRLVDGFRVTDIEEKFHCDLRKRYELVIERLSAGNLLEADKVWRLTDRGRLVADAVMSEFV